MTNKQYKERILLHTNYGLDIFTHYIGDVCTRKLFRNPYREDTHPSCTLKYRTDRETGLGKFFIVDYGDSTWHGDCFWFVAFIKRLDTSHNFREVLSIIDTDLNLFISDSDYVTPPTLPHVNLPSKPALMDFNAVYRNFNRAELDFWASYGITLPLLQHFAVKSLKSFSFTRSDGKDFYFTSSLEFPMYGYTFNGVTGVKIYRPGAPVRFMYAGILPTPYIFGLQQLPEHGDFLYITGGEKDVLSLTAHGFSAVCLNSESCHISTELFQMLSGRFHTIVFLYDSDTSGIRESALRVKECDSANVYRLTLPLAGTKQEKDVSDFFRLGHSAQELVNYTKQTIYNNK